MRLLKSFTSRLNFYVLSLTALFFLCIGIVFYLYLSKKETDNARRMTTSLVENISLNLDLEMHLIQETVENTSLQIFEYRNNPDMMMTIIENMLSKTDNIYGGGVAFKPNYFKSKGELFMEYAYWDNDSTLITRHLTSDELNYLEKEWYSDTQTAKNGFWSPPYASELEQHTVMISFSAPILDENGNIFAVVIADLALKDLTANLEKMNPYDGNYSFIITQDGTYLSHPNPSYILNQTIFSSVSFIEEINIKEFGEEIISKGEGTETFKINGNKYLASYSTIQTIDSIVCCITPYKSILKDLGRLTLYVLIILCISLLCLMVSIHYIVNRESAPVDIMEHDLRIARKIQEKLLPDVVEINNKVDRFDIAAYLRPARDVGGDMYDFFIDGQKLYFAIGDVSGKGTPAALIMSIIKCFFRSCSKGKMKAEDIIGSMNASIMENDLSDMFVTLFVGIIDLEKHNLSYCNAGHELPFLFTQEQEPLLLDGIRNFPIGVIKESDYKGESIPFIPGDKIFIYTDGVTDAENTKRARLGNDAVMKNLNKNTEKSAQEIIDSILSLINGHSEHMEQSDDITMMCIKLIR